MDGCGDGWFWMDSPLSFFGDQSVAFMFSVLWLDERVDVLCQGFYNIYKQTTRLGLFTGESYTKLVFLRRQFRIMVSLCKSQNDNVHILLVTLKRVNYESY